MATDGTFTGVVDRFEADRAVVLLEADGETIDEIVLDKDRLPEDGKHADAVLTIELVDGRVQEIVAVTERFTHPDAVLRSMSA